MERPRVRSLRRWLTKSYTGLSIGFSGGQSSQLADQQFPIERVGVIPVDLPPLGKRQVRKIEVVRVHVDERDRLGMQRLRDVPRHGRLSGSRSAGDADDQRFHRVNADRGIRGANCRNCGTN